MLFGVIDSPALSEEELTSSLQRTQYLCEPALKYCSDAGSVGGLWQLRKSHLVRFFFLDCVTCGPFHAFQAFVVVF